MTSISPSSLAFRISERHPLRARRFLHDTDLGLGRRSVWIHQQGDHPGLGYELAEQLEALRHQLDEDVGEAGKVAAGLGETGDQADPRPDRGRP